MAEVWEATDEVLGRPVAVKILHPHLAADDTFVAPVPHRGGRRGPPAPPGHRRRSTTPATTTTPRPSSWSWSTAPRCGPQLDERGFLPARARSSRIGAQVADALAAAHRAGLVHRDIKPANILLCDDGRVMVTDFGIAKIRDDPDVTQTGTMLGTVKYLAPEQVRGERLDGRADLYALGVVLYEALCARPPFTGDTPAATALARLHQPPPRPRQIRATVPRGLDAVVMRCLQLDRDHRYANALELRAALLEPSTLHEADDLTVATAVDPTAAWAQQATAAAAGAPPRQRQPAAAPRRRRAIVEPQRAVWVRPTLAGALRRLRPRARRRPDRPHRAPAASSSPGPTRSTSTSTIDGSPAGGADAARRLAHRRPSRSFDPGGRGRRPARTTASCRWPSTATPRTGWHTESYNERRSASSPASASSSRSTADADLGRLQRHLAHPGLGRVGLRRPTGPLPTTLADWGDPVDQQVGINGDATLRPRHGTHGPGRAAVDHRPRRRPAPRSGPRSTSSSVTG